ncbi:MAG: hypothetical protein ACT4NX_09010 [Deltaproteobacteria bacterium]
MPENQGKQKSMNWWQWLLIYPTLLVSIVGSVPTILEYYNSKKKGLDFGLSSIAERQNEMWEKNSSCSMAPYKWYKNNFNLSVDGTICKSGDIFIRVERPDNRTKYLWIPVDGFITKSTKSPFVSNAYAATPDSGGIVLAQYGVEVLCQRHIGDGRLLRRIKTPDGCFDEVVNTYSGEALSRTASSCDAAC